MDFVDFNYMLSVTMCYTCIWFLAVETYSWTAGAWSPCNIDCEQGVRSRRVICRSNWDGSAVADSFCTGSSPARQEKCNNVSCILFQPVWYGTEWSGVSDLFQCGIAWGGVVFD